MVRTRMFFSLFSLRMFHKTSISWSDRNIAQHTAMRSVSTDEIKDLLLIFFRREVTMVLILTLTKNQLCWKILLLLPSEWLIFLLNLKCFFALPKIKFQPKCIVWKNSSYNINTSIFAHFTLHLSSISSLNLYAN